MGFVDAITMIIPGISGTATLMMFGAYNSVINAFSSITNIYSLVSNLRLLIPFAIGMFVGIIFTAKLLQTFSIFHVFFVLYKKTKDFCKNFCNKKSHIAVRFLLFWNHYVQSFWGQQKDVS